MSFNNATLFQEWEGRIVPRSFSAGYVVLSYFVSYVGAWTTLELINRRTAMRGYYNWSLLVCSSISMGGIAIWCMHFIGNRAIILGTGQTFIQIAYSSGFTALSFFLPISVLFLAFWAVGLNERVSIVRVCLGGSLAGSGICGMHYLGQAGISNYDCVYTVAGVIEAAAIAIVASIGALGVFFVWRSSWETSWWKRAICAVFLAGAVSGMHWRASVGTQYRLRIADPSLANNISRNSTVIVVIVLSAGSCLVLVGFTFLAQIRRARSADRAQQVVLAAAVFDRDGRLMVSPEGLLPSRKITDTYIERSFDDVFCISHPVFLWIFQTTCNWSSITNLLPGMRNHIHHAGLKDPILGTKFDINLTNDHGDQIEDYSIIFRELFCVAAADLAEDLNKPLENLGILFDEIISTGQKPRNKGHSRTTPGGSVDLERDGLPLPLLGRGQLLFLVSRASRRESEHLQAAGYRFATAANVCPILARSMQIDSDELAQRIETMREYRNESHILEPGVHLGCFAIRASVRGGFDILVRKDARNQLPTLQLPIDNLESWQVDCIKGFDACTATACIKALTQLSKSTTASRKEQLFAAQLLNALEALRNEIADPFFDDALLIAKPVQAPCRGFGDDARPSQATLIAFRLIVPIHSRAPGTKLEFTSMRFFKTQQHVYENSPDHAVFARRTYREFSPVLDVAGRPGMAESRSLVSAPFRGRGKIFSVHSSRDNIQEIKMRGPKIDTLRNPIPRLIRKPSAPQPPSKLEKGCEKNWSAGRGGDEKIVKSDSSSEKGLVDLSGTQQGFGGIMVSQEVSVEVGDLGTSRESGTSLRTMDGKGGPGVEMVELGKNGVVSIVGLEEEEGNTFVDELFEVCVEGR